MIQSNHPTAILDLVALMKQLRSPDGCPWDREQTPQTLKPYLLEETYEVLEALDREDPAMICDELGDLLLQIVFLSQIYAEKGDFTIEDVARAITDKLVRRHPHVFQGTPFADLEELRHQWNRIKQEEKTAARSKSVGGIGVPHNLPALMRAQKFAGRDALPAREDLNAHVQTVFTASRPQEHEDKERLLAEILCAVVAWAQQHHIDSEQALRKHLLRHEESLAKNFAPKEG